MIISSQAHIRTHTTMEALGLGEHVAHGLGFQQLLLEKMCRGPGVRTCWSFEYIIIFYNLNIYIIYNTFYITLNYKILWYIILYCTILYYTKLYYTILYYIILYYTILYYTILYYTILSYLILYYIILYYIILYYTMLYYTMLLLYY